MKSTSIAVLATLAAFALPGSALAQCVAGMTASGECVDAGLAVGAQQTVIVWSQPKISYTAYPVLPNGDRNYRYPNQLNPDPNRSGSLRATLPACPRFGGC